MRVTSLKINMQPMPLFLNDKVYVIAGKRIERLLQQSLRRRPERLRGGRLRLIPQGRQCLRGYALVQAEVADGSVTASRLQ